MILVFNCLLLVSLSIFTNCLINRILAKNARNYFYNNKYKLRSCYEIFGNKSRMIEFVFCISIFILALLNGYSFFIALAYTVISILILAIYKKIREASVKKQVLCDLLNVLECLRVQLSSDISLGIALKNLAKLCKNKEFSRLLTNLHLEYELDKFTIENSAKALVSRFNYSEITMFISAIKQQSQHTSMLELIDNLISVLRERYIEFLEDSTKSKMAIMTLGVFIIVINIALIGVYPVLIESLNAMNIMFY